MILRLLNVYHHVRDAIDRRFRPTPPEMKIVIPSVFLELVINEHPDYLSVHLFGTDSGGCELDFLVAASDGPGTLYRVIFFPEMRPFPPIYRALLNRANDRGRIEDPMAILYDRRFDLVDFLGIDRVEEALDGRPPVPQQLAEA